MLYGFAQSLIQEKCALQAVRISTVDATPWTDNRPPAILVYTCTISLGLRGRGTRKKMDGQSVESTSRNTRCYNGEVEFCIAQISVYL